MGTMTIRIATLLWTSLLLIFLLASSADSTTIIKAYITTTKITANEQDAVAAARSATTTSELRSDAGERFREKDSLDLEFGKRVALSSGSGSLTVTTQPSSGYAAEITDLKGAEAENPSMLFLVGTHVVTFTAGEVQVIEGTSFSLGTDTRTLYATGSPYYVPNLLPSSSKLPGASHTSKSGSLVTNHGVPTLPASDSSATSTATIHFNSTGSHEVSSRIPQQAPVSTSTGLASSFSSTEVASSESQISNSTLDASSDVPATEASISTISEGVNSDGPSGSPTKNSSQSLTQSTSTMVEAQTPQATEERSRIGASESESKSRSPTQEVPSETSRSGTLLTSDTAGVETNHGTASTASSSVEHSSGADQTHTMAASSSPGTGGSVGSAHTSGSLMSSAMFTSSEIPIESVPDTESLSRAATASALTNTTRIVSMTRTENSGGNDSVSLLPTHSTSPASITQDASSIAAHNQSSSISSVTVTYSNTSASRTSNIESSSVNVNSSLVITSSSPIKLSSVSATDSESNKFTSPIGNVTRSSVSGAPTSRSKASGMEGSLNTNSTTLSSTLAANTAHRSSSSGEQKSPTHVGSGDKTTSSALLTTSEISGNQSMGHFTAPRGTGTESIVPPRPRSSKSSEDVTTPGGTGAEPTVSPRPSPKTTASTTRPFVTPVPTSFAPSGNVSQTVTLMAGEWRKSATMMSCKPPCRMTLPPIRLDPSAVLHYPAVTTSICTSIGSQIYRYVTTVSVDPLTITDLTLQAISIGTMTSGQPAVTSKADFIFPPAMCSLALPPGDLCEKRPLDSTNGTCGPQYATGCPDMQCCGPQGTCGTSKNECAKESGCQHDFGPCWLDGEESFLPLSKVFPPATDSLACPLEIRPTLPIDGPIITGILPEESDTILPTSALSSTTDTGAISTPGPTMIESGTVLPISTSSSTTGAVAILPPGIAMPRLCILCPPKVKPPPWTFDLQCRGPLCKDIGPRGGGGLCKDSCNLLECQIGCKKEQGSGEISGDDEPPPDPEDPEDPTKSADCETKTATEVTALCNIFTQFQAMSKRSGSTLSAPHTTCTSTNKRVTQGCHVTPVTTTIFDSCSKTQTATDFTKFCTESVSAGATYTPCTKTVSTVFEGCSVSATTTTVIDDACQAKVTLAPDDPQGEFGTMPEMSSNETCPYFPGVNVTVLDDQGSDGQKQNDSCPILNGTRTNIDDDQGDEQSIQSCPMNNTITLEPDGASVNDTVPARPINNTIVLEPDGALDNDTVPSCDNPVLSPDLTAEQELDQGEDGLSQHFCPMGGNDTLEVDNEQGEDGDRQQCEDEEQQQCGVDSCPVIPDGVILSPLADLGDYAPVDSSCPLLDSRYPISWLDEQGDDWNPAAAVPACPLPNITVSELPDEPEESDDSTLSSSTRSSTKRLSATGPSSTRLSASGSLTTGSSTNTSSTHASSTDSPSTTGSSTKKSTITHSSATRSTTTRPSITSSSTSSEDCRPPDVEGLGKCALVTVKKNPPVLQPLSLGPSWSCECQWQYAGQVVTPTTICGTRMCPNWQTTSTRKTTEIDTGPLYTFTDPTPTTTEYVYPKASCDCSLPTQADVGLCSTVTAAIYIGPWLGQNYCACESAALVKFSTVCGKLVCPNLKDTAEFTAPTPCPTANCRWPFNPNFGRCVSKTVERLADESQSYPLTDYCVCAGAGTTRVNLLPGCDGSRVCPNQVDLVTSTWTAATEKWCPTVLPRLPFFESCDLYTSRSTSFINLPGRGFRDRTVRTSTFCTCNNYGDELSTWRISTVYQSCGGFLCHNSAPLTLVSARDFEPDTRVLQHATSATAVKPLIAVTEDATPGSVPTTAGPTSSPGSGNVWLRGR